MPEKKDATLHIELRADSGARSSLRARINADQWTRIWAILHEDDAD